MEVVLQYFTSIRKRLILSRGPMGGDTLTQPRQVTSITHSGSKYRVYHGSARTVFGALYIITSVPFSTRSCLDVFI